MPSTEPPLVDEPSAETRRDEIQPLVAARDAGGAVVAGSAARTRCVESMRAVVAGDLRGVHDFTRHLIDYLHEDLPSDGDLYAIGRCISTKAVDILTAAQAECDADEREPGGGADLVATRRSLLQMLLGAAACYEHTRLLGAAHLLRRCLRLASVEVSAAQLGAALVAYCVVEASPSALAQSLGVVLTWGWLDD